MFAAVAALALATALVPGQAHAGGAVGWADAVNEFSLEGIGVGQAATVLGIVAVGAIMMFGITGLLPTTIMLCLGAALMANALGVAGIFGGGGGGGSIHDVVIEAQVAPGDLEFRPEAVPARHG